MKALFAAEAARPPRILWDPAADDVAHPVLRSFLRSCAGESFPLPLDWADGDTFGTLAEFGLLLERIPGQDDFVYLHYGAEIAAAYGTSMRGRRVSDLGGHVAQFFLALYLAAIERRQSVLSVHEPPRQVFVRAWHRVILPLADATGEIRRFAVVNLPDNELRAGLDTIPEAVMVVAADGMVCFANRAACLMFDKPRSPLAGSSFAAFTGLKIDLPRDPEALVVTGGQVKQRCMRLSGQRVLPVELTVGATVYREAPFLVITARELGA